jgi:gamma-glutamylaminecyclotransferase
MNMSKTILFVYGTLKSGQGNNHLLAGQEFVRAAETVPIYRLVGLGWHPGLVVDRESGLAVKGELWSVDEHALARLDEYEGVPHWFRRDFIAIADLAGDVQAYFFNGDLPADAASGAEWPLPE